MHSIICLFVHYYDKKGKFEGKSKRQDINIRSNIVSKSFDSLNSLGFVDVLVCGYGKKNIIDIHIDMNKYTNDPRLMMYEALCSLYKYRNDYDYFMVVEDDILVKSDVFENVFSFDASGKACNIFHPNRIENNGNRTFCVDTEFFGTFRDKLMTFKGRELAVHENPHSGILLVNRDKLDIIKENVDHSYRGRFIGGYMASAFAHFHKPFQLFRVRDGLDFHTIEHLDRAELYKPTLIQKITDRLLFRKNILPSRFHR